MTKTTKTAAQKRSKQHPRDVEVGKKLRSLRKKRGMTQSAIAKEQGISVQQIQKYEIGSNRISVSRLCDLAEAFNIHPCAFFEGMTFKYEFGEIEDTDDTEVTDD